MPLRDPDATLRALIAELAALHADDVAAVLGALSETERQVIEARLDQHAAPFEVALAAGAAAPFDAAKISAWLASRLEMPAAGNDTMTAQARQTLLACAIRLYPAGGRAA